MVGVREVVSASDQILLPFSQASSVINGFFYNGLSMKAHKL